MFYNFDYQIYMFIGLALGGVGMLVQSRLRSKFEQYAKMPISKGWTGKEVAERMLRYYNIFDVQIVQADGFLSDHYNPGDKTVNLSSAIYQGQSIMSAAVAAHECGHAVQHAQAYAALTFRSAIVPVVNVAASFQQYILLGAFMLANQFPSLLLIAILVFGVTTLFSVVTLPVEFDASNRALAWLDESRTLQPEEYKGAKDALWWAAMTYVVAALSSVAQLLYLIFRFMGARNRN
ncbi:MAG: hypothetical protein RI894_2120 [Bacteroidota bacterium]|jgi:Zn-dependent membrane protease YugP